MIKKSGLILLGLILLNFILNLYGNDWGLPSRWHVDEKIANVLHMAHQRILYDPNGLFLHPTGYHIFLLAALVPFYLVLLLINYPLAGVKGAASISWIHMANQYPDFATNIYLYGRALSALLGAATVYLIYLLGKELYNKRAGLLSAALLSVSMGFIGVNHFAKYISLLNLFIVFTLYACVRALKANTPESSQKWLLGAFFLGGLTTSIHLNGPFLLLPIGLTFLMIRKQVFKCIGLYITGFLVGMPSIITHFSSYLSVYTNKYSSELATTSSTWLTPIAGIMNYITELASIYGLPIMICITIGMFMTSWNWKKVSKGEWLIIAFSGVYFLIITTVLQDKYPQTKHIIAIVPLLVLFGGKMLDKLLALKKVPKVATSLAGVVIFGFSFVYSLSGITIFKRGDTRHIATEWILKNVPFHSKIELFNQLNYVASTTIMNYYDIVYLGKSSKISGTKKFFKWNRVEKRESYLKEINHSDSTSEYIVIDITDMNDLYSESFMHHIPGVKTYLQDLFSGKKNYQLTSEIHPRNKKVNSTIFPGWVHFEDFLWKPVPNYTSTSNSIYIFKRRDLL